jgi:hypothetical protein
MERSQHIYYSDPYHHLWFSISRLEEARHRDLETRVREEHLEEVGNTQRKEVRSSPPPLMVLRCKLGRSQK